MKRISLGLVAALVVAAPSAFADEVSALRSKKLAEKSHVVALTLDRGHAKLVVTRTVYNGGERHDQATFMIDLPDGAVATGLRTLGALNGRPHWFAGELMEAEAAAEKYRELTGIGGYYPKDPALLSWRTRDRLALQVFPCPPYENKSVEYTLQIPTTYAGGRHGLVLPAMGTRGLLARMTVRPARTGDRVLVDGKPVSPGGRVRLRKDQARTLELVPRKPAPLEAGLASMPIDNGRALSRFRVEAAPKLGTVPRGAYVAVVIDASKSVEDAYAAGAVSAARAYLSHFPDARVEIVTFDRQPRPRYGGFVGVDQARADLETLTLNLKNGSHVETALEKADSLLKRAPGGAARRILLLTDGSTRSALKPARLRASVGSSKALLHIGIVDRLDPRLEPANAHPWAETARQTGGLLWRTGANASPTEQLAQERLFEEWARPTKIHGLKVEAQHVPSDELAVPPVLHEGEGLTDLRIAHARVGWVKLTGELWATPITRTFTPTAPETKRWAALSFGTAVVDALNDAQMMKLAMHGGAVSPVTSYLAIEPGVRPSTEGIDWGAGFGSGFGAVAPRVRMGMTSVGSRIPPFDPHQYLKDNLSLAWTACGGDPNTATVQLETTLDEVVDVTQVDLPDGTAAALNRCLTQAVWDLDLPDRFDDPWRAWMVRV